MSEPIHEMTAAERVALVEREKHRITYRNITLSFAGILLFLLIWEGLALSGIVDSRILCDVLEVLRLFVTKLSDPNPDGAVLTVHIWSSLQVALLGFLLAVVIGVPLGWLMGWYRGADSFLRPIFEIIRPIPPVSWIPLTIVWLGIGLPAKSFIVFFAAFVPCLILYRHPADQGGPEKRRQDLWRFLLHCLRKSGDSFLFGHDFRRHQGCYRQRLGHSGGR